MKTKTGPVVVRMASPEFEILRTNVFRRYPTQEWASFAFFGWRESSDGIVLTLATIDIAGAGELDESVGHVAIQEPYTLRVALGAEKSELAVGVVHSHPLGCRPSPSSIDDDMDGYFSKYFESFTSGRPYVSLILAEVNGQLCVSGRVYWRGGWSTVTKVIVAGAAVTTWPTESGEGVTSFPRERTARLNAAFGDDAAERLRAATVAVIGAGGTGSAAIEILARAGVGHLILIDPDLLDESNLERIHGSVPSDAVSSRAKVSVAKQHAQAIDPTCKVTAIRGAVPQALTVDALVEADVMLCCTDSHASRLAVSDLCVRYLIAAIDCGVTLEGKNGRISGQIMQLVRFLPSDPCVLCRGMIIPNRASQELMSEEVKTQRREAAALAARSGKKNAAAYWQDIPQLNTVGYLTSAAGAIAAGYAVGWITHRFQPPFERLQMNLTAPLFDVSNTDLEARTDCTCRRTRGYADQGSIHAYVTPPDHWAPAVQV